MMGYILRNMLLGVFVIGGHRRQLHRSRWVSSPSCPDALRGPETRWACSSCKVACCLRVRMLSVSRTVFSNNDKHTIEIHNPVPSICYQAFCVGHNCTCCTLIPLTARWGCLPQHRRRPIIPHAVTSPSLRYNWLMELLASVLSDRATDAAALCPWRIVIIWSLTIMMALFTARALIDNLRLTKAWLCFNKTLLTKKNDSLLKLALGYCLLTVRLGHST